MRKLSQRWYSACQGSDQHQLHLQYTLLYQLLPFQWPNNDFFVLWFSFCLKLYYLRFLCYRINIIFLSMTSFCCQQVSFIKELRADKEQLILTADKGVALVLIDKKEYTEKMQQLLEDKNTYRPLKMDPTNRQKNRLINILRSIKSEGRLEDHIYKKMYPTGASSPKLYGLLRSTRRISPWDPLFPAKAPSLMG